MIRSCLVLLVLAGCTRTSTKYCGMHPDDTVNCPAPDAPGVTTCMTSNDCVATPDTLVCNTTTETCVECDAASSQTSACIDTQPICGDDDACRACRSHAECASGACLPDGRCGSDQTVAFIEGNAPGSNPDCTQTAPCDKFADALALSPGRAYIKITGTIDENVTINDRNVTILAAPNARLIKGSGTLLAVTGTSQVAVYDLQIGNATTATTLGAFLDATTGSLSLHRVRVTNNVTGGIRANAGTLNVYRSTIADNPGGGIRVDTGAAGFDIRNNFIYSNGRGTSASATLYGGVLIENAVGRVEYNTVVYNECDGAQNRAGIACFGSATSATGNIAFGNREALLSLDTTQAAGTCQWGNTFRLGMGDLGFVDANTIAPNLHLTVNSPSTVRDAGGACGTANPDDIDGNPRPYGIACDLGADELSP